METNTTFWGRNRARIGAGALLLASYGGPILRWLDKIVGWGGSFDFLLSRSEDPGWLGVMVGAFFFPPAPLQLVAIIIAIVFVVRAERQRNETLYGSRSLDRPAHLPPNEEPSLEQISIAKLERKLAEQAQQMEEVKQARTRLRNLESCRSSQNEEMQKLPGLREEIEGRFALVMKQLEAASHSSMGSIREGPKMELRSLVQRWEMALRILSNNFQLVGDFDFTDFSEYSRDPLTPGAKEPPNLEQSLQAAYRKFAAQRDAFEKRHNAAQAAFSGEVDRLRGIAGG